jgi:magnesium transporter
MLRILRSGAKALETAPEPLGDWRLPEDAVWIDLYKPTLEQERRVEGALGLSLPTREDMVEIEASSRLYQEDGATFTTANLLCNSEGELPTNEPVTFVLAGERLVTIRYAEPRSFPLYEAQLERQDCATGLSVLLGLLDVIVDRSADILEKIGGEVEAMSHEIFGGRRAGGFRPILQRLGRAQHVNGKLRDSLVTLGRMTGFVQLDPRVEHDREARGHLKSLARDLSSITDHATYVSSQAVFLLDAALGQINIEQNDIIKIFSVAAVAFLPPTLIASIYGMNFHHMPELDWRVGYPLAIGAMVLSAAVPLWWFKRKGWL